MAVSAAGASCEHRAMRAAAVASVSKGWTLQSVFRFVIVFAIIALDCEEVEDEEEERAEIGGQDGEGVRGRRCFPPTSKPRLACNPPPKTESQFSYPPMSIFSVSINRAFVPGTSSCARTSDPEKTRSRAREAATNWRSIALLI